MISYLIVFVLLLGKGSCHGETSLRFMLLGDWGLPGLNQSLVAEQMGLWSSENHANFVIALGDNFYCKWSVL
jgi:hypothetical protein